MNRIEVCGVLKIFPFDVSNIYSSKLSLENPMNDDNDIKIINKDKVINNTLNEK